jgi:bifunctional DNA-binding transcriptional regulator/antitoxin component of YhaV-PrlF toxin-antitoxin module
MPLETRELYRIADGDRWSLIRDPGSGRVFVRHEPNASSGGRASDIEVGDFLVRGGGGPEHQELLRLIGTLVEGGPSGA